MKRATLPSAVCLFIARAYNLIRVSIRAGKCVAAGLLCLLSASEARSADCGLPVAGLVAWWAAEGNADDIIGKHNGTLQGGVSYAAGEVAQAFSFDGLSGCIQIPDSDLWAFDTNDFTIELWANFNVAPSGSYGAPQGGLLIGNDEGGYDRKKWFFALGGGVLEFHINNPGVGGAFLAQSQFTPTPQQWYHLACVRRGSMFTMYVNGVAVGSDSSGIPVPNADAPLTIGQAEGYFFDGRLDEVSIYDHALSASVIGAIYDSGAAGKRAAPRTATGSAVLLGNFVVSANITDGGFGYTNIPLVRFFGGGGSGAQGFTTVSNGIVTGITITNAGYAYTNSPLVVIEPPFILEPVLAIAPMTSLSFSNLTIGGVYQLQQLLVYYWTNQPISFTASNDTYTQLVPGVAGSSDYRLAIYPAPGQAFAAPRLENGFVVGATLTSGGSGYVTSPAVSIVGGGGHNAAAFCQIFGGVVTSVTVTNAGFGYTNAPTVRIAPPPTAAVPPAVQPVMRVDASCLAPYDKYQISFKPDLSTPWAEWNGGLFIPTDVTNSQYLFITNGTGFFQLQYVP